MKDPAHVAVVAIVAIGAGYGGALVGGQLAKTAKLLSLEAVTEPKKVLTGVYIVQATATVFAVAGGYLAHRVA